MKEKEIEEAAKIEYGDFLLTDREQSLGKSAFIIGAKWMQKRTYSEEEVEKLITDCIWNLGSEIRIVKQYPFLEFSKEDLSNWFETNKKK